MNPTVNQNKRQRELMIGQFIGLWRGSEFTSMSAGHKMAELWGVKYDIHDIGPVLESMVASGQAEMIGQGPDRFAKYYIK